MLAFIIFGTRGIRSTIKEGKFLCPQCQEFAPYKHKKVTQFFTLYFIPLIPLGSKGTYVECQQCRNTFVERVLELSHIQAEQPRIQENQVVNQIEEAVVVNKIEENIPPKEFLSEKQKAIKKLLILMILADGKVENAEISAFHSIYKETTGLVVNDIYREIDDVKIENKSARQYLKDIAHLLNDEGKREIIKSSMMIAAADGHIDPTELNMISSFGKALGMSHSEIKEIVKS